MRYIIGIDLGTTNSCIAYADTLDPKVPVRVFKIPQLTREGTYEHLSTLPSFCYLADKQEWPKGSLDLPWMTATNFFVGSFARSHGAKVPTRLVQSAKSWLCHSAARRRDKILPLEAADETARISPLEASARYLGHIKEAWNHMMAKGDADAEFDAQEIILTVPASFDEVARALTVESAKLAGYGNVTLLEEPQAAFYCWLSLHETDWEQRIPLGSQILVCDVGGGTTDFSLIEVVSPHGKAVFQRMAVGNHLLLGGDNMDAALSNYLESRLQDTGHALSPSQRLQLLHEARSAKEALLGESKDGGASDSVRILLQGSGSSVVQGTAAITVLRNELRDLLFNGFFGEYEWTEALKLKKTSGFRSMGLPYESEPSIIKHLAHFLKTCAGHSEVPKQPDFVLFNGGAMKPPLFQHSIIDNINRWFPNKKVSLLSSNSHDMAVAKGAAYYGKARQGIGIRVGGGMARGYYLVLDAKEQSGKIEKRALTLLPRGSEEGSVFEPDQTFWLTPNTPVSFQLAASHTRLEDVSGKFVEIDFEEMQMLPPIHTLLRFGRRQAAEASQEKIPVRVHIELTPIGTLHISLKSLNTDHTWSLEFQVRTASGQDDSLAASKQRASDQTFSTDTLKAVEKVVHDVYSSISSLKPECLVEKLESTVNMPRRDWTPSLLRFLADALIQSAPQRKASSEHAMRWWNLTGFALRPGFGFPLDDFRVKELWKIILSEAQAPQTRDVQIQTWICFRRIAGGLNKGQQMQLAADLATVMPTKTGKIEFKNKSDIYPYSEKLRALAALELIDVSLKTRLGTALTARIAAGGAIPAEYWALGRLGARLLLYGSLANVVPKMVCEQWIQQLLKADLPADEKLSFLFGQIACKTAHPEIDISDKLKDNICTKFADSPYADKTKDLLSKPQALSLQDKEHAFGDSLPSGLLFEN